MKRKFSIIITVVAAVCAVALAAWGGYVFCTQVKVGEETPELYASIPIFIILIFLGAFLDELIHEGAHFMIGAFCSMGVKAPKIRIFKSSSVEVFPKGAKCLKLRFLLTAGAGLFFDALIIALGIIAFSVKSVPPVLGIGLPYALYSFIVNVVPFEYHSGKTDGLVIWEAIRNDPSSRVMFRILKIQGLVNGGLMLKEVDESLLLDVPQLPEDDLNFIILTQLRYEYYLAKGDDSTAYKYFLRYKDLIQYLPDEYGEEATVRRKVEEEMEDDEETDEVFEIPQANVENALEDKKEDVKQAEEEKPSEQPAEQSEEQSAEQPTEQAEEQQPAAEEDAEEAPQPEKKKKKSKSK
ncbi:MAG: hypothetical protein K2O44_01845 [Clostridia bacterium]|nr:hypothetical protein [Clostridia bacterium]